MTKTLIPKSKPEHTEIADDYFDLVRRFPLRPLKLHREFVEAGKILDEFIGRVNLTAGERDYLAALAHFVIDYETKQKSAKLERLKPLEILKHLMEENDMSTADLGYVVGSRGLASEVLNGNRGFSKTIIRKLASKFGVDPGLFLEVHED